MKYLQGKGKYQHIYDVYVHGNRKQAPHLNLLWVIHRIYKLCVENGVDNWYHISLFVPEAVQFKCPSAAPKSVKLFFGSITNCLEEFVRERVRFMSHFQQNHQCSSESWKSFLEKHKHFSVSVLEDILDDTLVYVEVQENRQKFKITKKTITKARMVQEAMV